MTAVEGHHADRGTVNHVKQSALMGVKQVIDALAFVEFAVIGFARDQFEIDNQISWLVFRLLVA